MSDIISYNIDDETISKLGLIITTKEVNAPGTPHARVFEYPHLDNVFIMENDLYGTTMPEHTCFIAFNGRHGLVGKHLTIDELKSSTVEGIRKLVDDNCDG